MTAKNGTRLLKPAIVLKRPDRREEGNHDKHIKCCVVYGILCRKGWCTAWIILIGNLFFRNLIGWRGFWESLHDFSFNRLSEVSPVRIMSKKEMRNAIGCILWFDNAGKTVKKTIKNNGTRSEKQDQNCKRLKEYWFCKWKIYYQWKTMLTNLDINKKWVSWEPIVSDSINLYFKWVSQSDSTWNIWILVCINWILEFGIFWTTP